MPTQRRSRRIGKTTKARWNPKRERQGRDMRRKKISTTVAAESCEFLHRLIAEGKAGSLAEALDMVLDEARVLDNRERLDRMTAEGYESMSPEAIEETRDLEEALTRSVGEINL